MDMENFKTIYLVYRDEDSEYCKSKSVIMVTDDETEAKDYTNDCIINSYSPFGVTYYYDDILVSKNLFKKGEEHI